MWTSPLIFHNYFSMQEQVVACVCLHSSCKLVTQRLSRHAYASYCVCVFYWLVWGCGKRCSAHHASHISHAGKHGYTYLIVCLYVLIYIYTYMCTHNKQTHIHTYYIRILTCMHVCMHAFVYIHMQVYVQNCNYTLVNAHTRTSTHEHTYMHMISCMHSYINSPMHSFTHTCTQS